MKLAYTIVSKNYLAQASILLDSFFLFNSDYEFYVFTIDEFYDFHFSSIYRDVNYLSVFNLDVDEIPQLRLKYNNFEFANALKPFLGEYLINNIKDLEFLIYLDSDLKFFQTLNISEFLNAEYRIFLTPHLLTPIPLDNSNITELDILNSGLFNAGFFGLIPSKEVDLFLRWWKKRMQAYSYINFSKGMFVDQIWLNLVPFYFDKVFILRNVGLNVGHWCLHERYLNKIDNTYYVNNNEKLIFFHFSGVDPNNHIKISKYCTRYDLATRDDLLEVFNDYLNELKIKKNIFPDIVEPETEKSNLSIKLKLKKKLRLYLKYLNVLKTNRTSN